MFKPSPSHAPPRAQQLVLDGAEDESLGRGAKERGEEMEEEGEDSWETASNTWPELAPGDKLVSTT